jgi:hypothetical protein
LNPLSANPATLDANAASTSPASTPVRVFLAPSARWAHAVTNKEAKQLFSSMDDDYAFGEMEEVGKGNIAWGAGLLMRKADAGP